MSNARRFKLRKEKQKAKFQMVCVIIALVFTLLCITAYAWGGNSSSVVYKEVTVAAGDTVWEIAARYTVGRMDVRQIIYEMEQVNDVSYGNLQVGDVLLVPVYY